jgi:pimeloyl-ACP methyl ester carboxylesterase
MVATDDGAGQPIVVLGGIISSGSGPTSFEERLASRRRVIRLRHLAAEAGASGQVVKESYGVSSERCAMLAAMDRLLGDTPVDIVGYSLGGLIALDFALHHPQRVRSLTLIEPPARWILTEQELLQPEQRRAAAATMRAKRRIPTESETAALLCAGPFRCPPGDELQHLRQMPLWPMVMQNRAALSAGYVVVEHRPSRLLLQELRAPVLYVSGTGTSDFHAGINGAFRRSLPRARYRELPGGHAAPTVSAQSLADAVLEFTTR